MPNFAPLLARVNAQVQLPVDQNRKVNNELNQNPFNVPVTLRMNLGNILRENQANLQNVPPGVLTGTEILVTTESALDLRDELVNASLVPRTTLLNLVSGNREPTAVVMPTAGVAAGPGESVADKIAAKVRDGAALYRNIVEGAEPARTKANAALLMWYLQALGSSKAGLSDGHPERVALFKSGAFTIADPGNRLKNWLSGFNVYERSSSHLNGFQGLPGCKPHGLDIRGVETPNERRTILFAKIPNPTNPTGVLAQDDPPLLYFKMEEHGCRGLSFKGTGDKTGVLHGIKRFFANLRDFAGHSMGFLQSLTQRGGLQGQDNRERVNKGILQPYEDLLSALERQDGVGRIKDILKDPERGPKRGDKTGGIHLMVGRLNEALELLATAKREAAGDANRQDAIGALELQLNTTREALRAKGDHSEVRFGREVILTPDEMLHQGLGVNPLRLGVPAGDEPAVTHTGTLSQLSRKALLAGLTYQLANLPYPAEDGSTHAVNEREQFDLDVPRVQKYAIGEVIHNRDAEVAEAGADDYRDNVNRTLDNLVANSADPPFVADAIRLLSHQGAYAALLDAITSDAIAHTGYALSTNFSNTSFEINHVQDGVQSIYRLKVSGSVSGNVDNGRHLTFVPTTAGAAAWWAGEGSEARAEQTLLLTYNRVRRTLSLAFAPDAPPSFSYTVDRLREPQLDGLRAPAPQ